MTAAVNDAAVQSFWAACLARDPARKRIALAVMQDAASELRNRLALVPGSLELVAAFTRTLEAQGVVRLPSGRGHYDRRTNPPVPLFVERCDIAKREATSNHKLDHMWHPRLGFLAGLAVLRNAEDWLAVDTWLKRRGGADDVVSLRERSWEIFGDEKRLEAVLRFKAFEDGQIAREVFRCDEVCEPLVARLDPAAGGATAICIENKDTFRSFIVANQRYHVFTAVIFGAGGSASGRLQDVATLRESVPIETLLYFGDIDAPGIQIALRTKRAAEAVGGLGFALATTFYRALLSAAVPTGDFGGHLDAAAKQFLEGEGLPELDSAGRGRIPQEALARSAIDALVREMAGGPASAS